MNTHQSATAHSWQLYWFLVCVVQTTFTSAGCETRQPSATGQPLVTTTASVDAPETMQYRVIPKGAIDKDIILSGAPDELFIVNLSIRWDGADFNSTRVREFTMSWNEELKKLTVNRYDDNLPTSSEELSFRREINSNNAIVIYFTQRNGDHRTWAKFRVIYDDTTPEAATDEEARESEPSAHLEPAAPQLPAAKDKALP